MKDHYIVCGFGRVGRQISQELANRHVPFVIIDKDPQRIEQAEKDGFLFVQDLESVLVGCTFFCHKPFTSSRVRLNAEGIERL